MVIVMVCVFIDLSFRRLASVNPSVLAGGGGVFAVHLRIVKIVNLGCGDMKNRYS